MMVFTKVLFGSIRITAYDWKDQTDAYLRGAYYKQKIRLHKGLLKLDQYTF